MKPNLKAVAAAAASSIHAFLFFIFHVITCSRCKRNRGRSNPEELSSIPVDESIAVNESASFNPKLRISMEELRNVTEDFHPLRIIGNGSFGLVFKACLTNGLAVAIKKLGPDAFEGFREFRAEMETLGKLQHPNIVRILGYCTSNSDRVLVYEFIERGSLDQWLYNTMSPSEDGDVLS
ncbi:hypothetical protein NL676_026415 [Syzygium grande]|nr:hypothetical protein NL676_026415 [Syzygium grande]